MENYHDLNIISKFEESEWKSDVLEAEISYESVNEECDASESEENVFFKNEEFDESKTSVIETTNIFQSETDGISEFSQDLDYLNTIVKSEPSGSDEGTNEKTDASEEDIEDSKCFVQQYLDEEGKLRDDIDTIGTTNCFQQTTLVECKPLEIGIQSGCDEIIKTESNVSEAEDSKCVIHQYMDEEGKFCNNIDTIFPKKEGVSLCAETQLNEIRFPEYKCGEASEAANMNNFHRCESSLTNGSDLNSGSECNLEDIHLEVKTYQINFETRQEKKFGPHIDDEFVIAQKKLLRIHDEKPDIELKIHECHMCKFTTVQRQSLEVHMEAVHQKLRINKYRQCDYINSQEDALESHLDSIHLKLKKHKCQECEFRTCLKSHLYQHINSEHLKLKNHKCRMCEFTTTRQDSLKSHINNEHLKLKNHKCQQCQYTASCKSNLKTHINSVHLKLKKHKCQECEFRTSIKSHLYQHISSVHLKFGPHIDDEFVIAQRKPLRIYNGTKAEPRSSHGSSTSETKN